MSTLVPFEQNKEAIAILSSGKALAVEFVFEEDGPYKGYKKYYFDLLGYSMHPNMTDVLKPATILSEIGNMPGHYVVVGQNNKVITGLHGDLFYVDTEELEDIKGYQVT